MTAETELPAYLPYPRFLLKMDISHTAKLLYVLLLDRSTLSQKNGWQDSEGRTYIVYPIAEIAEMLDKGCTTIKGALKALETKLQGKKELQQQVLAYAKTKPARDVYKRQVSTLPKIAARRFLMD